MSGEGLTTWHIMSTVVREAFPKSDRWGWMTYLPPNQDIMVVSLATTTEARHAITGVDMVKARPVPTDLMAVVRNICIRGVIEEMETTIAELRERLEDE